MNKLDTSRYNAVNRKKAKKQIQALSDCIDDIRKMRLNNTDIEYLESCIVEIQDLIDIKLGIKGGKK